LKKAVTAKLMDVSDKCTIEIVSEGEWESIRLLHGKAQDPNFRKLAKNLYNEIVKREESVTTIMPKHTNLFRKKATCSPLFNQVPVGTLLRHLN